MVLATSRSPRWLALSFCMLSAILAPRARAAADESQLVRLSLVEGDVRFARGDGRVPDLMKQWQQAEVNLPVEEGFSLATGAGRAEVEFEDGSVAYLAENSVLQFRVLRVRNHRPFTQIEVLIGTATVSIHHVEESSFIIFTPSERIFFSEDTLLRVDRFVDGTRFTAEGKNGTNADQADGGKLHQARGQTIVYEPDGTVSFVESRSAAAGADWDAWVDARVQGRKEEMGAAMKAAGLTSPLPGLIDLYRGGAFFPCAPYGTCWQPNTSAPAGEPSQRPEETAAENSLRPPPEQPATALAVEPALPLLAETWMPDPQAAPPIESPIAASREAARQFAGQAPAQGPGTPAPPASQAPQLIRRYFGEFSCPRVVTAVDSIRDPATGKEKVVKQEIVDYQAYDFALCHSGTWINRYGRYVFLLGKRPRHHPPVCWVKVGNVKGYVPRHPDDVKGRFPKNLKYGVFVPPHTQAGAPARVSVRSSEKVEVLARAPREFHSDSSALSRTDRPQIQARLTGLDPHGDPVPVRYDYRRQLFLQDVRDEHAASSRPVAVGMLTSHGFAISFAPVGSHGGNSAGSGSAGHTNNGGGGAGHNSGSGAGHSGGGGHSSAGGGGGRSSDNGGSRSSDGGASHSGGGGSSGGGGGDRGRP